MIAVSGIAPTQRNAVTTIDVGCINVHPTRRCARALRQRSEPRHGRFTHSALWVNPQCTVGGHTNRARPCVAIAHASAMERRLYANHAR